jgi:HEAT repeat protein
VSRMAEIRAELEASASLPGRRMDLVRSIMDQALELDGQEMEDLLAGVFRDDPDPIVRHEAVFIIGCLVSWGRIKGEEAFPLIRDASLQDPSVVVRHESIEALSNYHTPASIAVCVQALEDPHVEVSATARITLERIWHQAAEAAVQEEAREALVAAGFPPAAG